MPSKTRVSSSLMQTNRVQVFGFAIRTIQGSEEPMTGQYPVLITGGVGCIDENVEGPGVRLKKQPKT